ncbi:hypothetical protein BY996DRAFT_491609 [Phakopsora pachyrhizi]|uniref:Expressed protein n=1 Tax=Phakopsora pachyrhizi TaxID=170000 RepID=A0A0S1MKS9_PHAPC|nr:hypothetical protein BY996DRAFT_491609 [Phakopsora pachyrhizi]CAH7670801.1 expressed protein [Phakopsora pachyrhizi]
MNFGSSSKKNLVARPSVGIRRLVLVCTAMVWSITLILSQPSGVNSSPIFKIAKTIAPTVVKAAAAGGGLIAVEQIASKVIGRSTDGQNIEEETSGLINFS